MCFDNVKKNFGFGCMRLPLLESGEVDTTKTCKMVDTFLYESSERKGFL